MRNSLTVALGRALVGLITVTHESVVTVHTHPVVTTWGSRIVALLRGTFNIYGYIVILMVMIVYIFYIHV